MNAHSPSARHLMIRELLRQLGSSRTDERIGTRLIPFVQSLVPSYIPSQHHVLIAKHLEAVEAGAIDRLMIVMPPRHGKSELASVNFPAWYLGRNPDKRIIACSHTAALAYRFSRQARDKLTHPTFPFGVQLAQGAATVHQWNLANHGGGYVAAGVRGPITGQGAHLLLIDDPVKSAEEAASRHLRDTTWEWYQGTAYTRLEPGAAVVVIGTRWHQDDLLGRLLAEQLRGGDRWTVLHLPALAMADDPLGREVDAPLWPDRFDAESLARIRQSIGAYHFTAQYQGTPGNRETSVIPPHVWDWYDEPQPRYRRVVAFCDTAFKTDQRADYSVISLWGERRDQNGYDVLNVWRDRVDFPSLLGACERIKAGRWRPTHWVVEDRASGQSLIQVLRQRGFPAEAYQPGTRDKLERVHAITGYLAAGLVRLPRQAAWTDGFVTEHADFPEGVHDDQVDTTAMALHWFEVSKERKLQIGLEAFAGAVAKTNW